MTASTIERRRSRNGGHDSSLYEEKGKDSCLPLPARISADQNDHFSARIALNRGWSLPDCTNYGRVFLR